MTDPPVNVRRVSVVPTSTVSSSVGPARRRSGPRRLPAVLAAVAVLLVVIEGGVLFWQQQPPQYSAMTTLVVLPAGNSAEAASYYDTLSRGQIATTFAEILALRATPEGGKSEVTVEVVPETSLIQVTATADTARSAESAADQALGRAEPYFNQLGSPYAVSVVQDAAGTAEHAGLTVGILAGVVAAVALIAAFSAYLAVRGLQNARAQARLVDGQLSGGDDIPVADATVPAPGRKRAVDGSRGSRSTKAARAAMGSTESQRAAGDRDADGPPGWRQRPGADPLPPQPAQ
jgi:capsular polysaccharide biosynthesis protein